MTTIQRGEIWEVRFDPSEGDEIRKVRPAVVLSAVNAGRMELKIVVPITSWKPLFELYFWIVRLSPTPTNGLSKESAADAFQVKSLSIARFQTSLGTVTVDELEEIITAVMICIGYKPDLHSPG